MNSNIRKAVFALAAIPLLSVPLNLFADGGEDNFMSIVLEGQTTVTGMKISGGFFEISRADFNDEKFKNTTFVIPYEIELIDKSDGADAVISKSAASATLKSGAKSVKINADALVKKLQAKIKKKGAISIKIDISSDSRLYCVSPAMELEIFNAEYQKSMIDNMAGDSGKMQQMTVDFENFMMKNTGSGKDPDAIKKDFYKKYPQYKGMLPE